jgi:hypothetical protein
MPNQKHINKKHLAHLEVVRRQDRIIRISALVIILLVVGIVGYGFLSNTVLLPYREVASVNGDKITAGEFQTQVKIQRIQAINRYMQYMQYAQMFGVQDPLNDANFGPMLQQDANRLNSPEVMGQEVVDLLINDRLIRQETKKRGITVSAAEVDKALQESFQYFPNGTPTAAPTATEAVTPTLNPTELAIVTITPTASPVPTATQEPNITPTVTPTNEPSPTVGPTATNQPTATAVNEAGYKTLLKERIDGLAKDTGLDEASYRRMLEISLLRDKLMAEVTKDQQSTQDEVWARHILVATQVEAEAVIARLKAGEDFGKIASQVSTDTGSKDKGGDLGWFGKGAMVAPFEEAAFKLNIGQISDPIKSDYGFHIIQVIGHEIRPLTDQQVTQNKQTEFTAFLKTLRDASDVKIYDLWKSIVPTEPALPSTTGQ